MSTTHESLSSQATRLQGGQLILKGYHDEIVDIVDESPKYDVDRCHFDDRFASL